MHLANGKVLGSTLFGLSLFVPSLAFGQPPPDLASSLRFGAHLNPSVWHASPPIGVRTPALRRVKPAGPVFIRIHGGFIAGQSSLGFAGFLVGGGVAIPIAQREDMEIQVDFSFAKYSGGPETDSFSTIELDGKAIAPTVLFLYNFVREGRKVTPFVGGGTILARIDETETETIDFPGFHSVNTFRTRGWLSGPQGVAGVQIQGNGRATFRVETRLGFTLDGGLVVIVGGVSF